MLFCSRLTILYNAAWDQSTWQWYVQLSVVVPKLNTAIIHVPYIIIGVFMAALRSRCRHYIFILWFLLSFFLLLLFFLT